ncbi:MAG: hypothetical protein AABY22_35730, partial [Nanoarchaeota archaeon]
MNKILLYLPIVQWHGSVQRPQHLCFQAADFTVYHVHPTINANPPQLKETGYHNIYEYIPPIAPYPGRGLTESNENILFEAILSLIENANYILIWVNSPYWFRLVRFLKSSNLKDKIDVAYDNLDIFEYFSDLIPFEAKLKEEHAAILELSDYIFYTSDHIRSHYNLPERSVQLLNACNPGDWLYNLECNFEESGLSGNY